MLNKNKIIFFYTLNLVFIHKKIIIDLKSALGDKFFQMNIHFHFN
jgi:hypothetical protein